MSPTQRDQKALSGPLRGLCSALLVPRTAEHIVDYAATERLIQIQRNSGVRAMALNGATSEYTRSSPAEIQILLRFIHSLLDDDAVFVLGVGAADAHSIQNLMDIGNDVGVDGFLLPVPHYFPLAQEDIVSLIDSLKLHRPTYLYNLPSFTTPIEPDTSLLLCGRNAGIVGVKDSSGSLDTVTLLSERARGAARIIGNDGVLHEALRKNVCDGVVSGVAGVLPEFMLTLYEETELDATSERSLALQDTLAEYISWLNHFPVPWGLKLTAEVRGLLQAEFSLPLSDQRRESARQFAEWIAHNRERLLIG